MLQDYQVPPFFSEDLFSYAGATRPPFRWILIGPAGTGSYVHIDPLGTSAWNTLIQGTKKWVLLPPCTPANWVKFGQPDGVEGDASTTDDESVTALDWFTRVLPCLRSSPGFVEFDQQSGETVFIPAGWWHAVLNMDDTVAVTQNFVSSGNFQGVWDITCHARPELAKVWLQGLQSSCQHSKADNLQHIVEILSTSPIQPLSSSAARTLPPLKLPSGRLMDLIRALKTQQSLRRELFWETSGAHTESMEDLQNLRAEENSFLESVKQCLQTEEGKSDVQGPSVLLLACGLIGEVAGEVVEALLEAKANPDAKEGGHFALGLAAHVGEVDTCRALLKYGADVHVADVGGRNALIIAAEAGADSVVKLLLGTRQLDINCVDQEKRTPLLAAAESGRERVLGLLLQRKARMDLKDEDGRHPSDIPMNSPFF
jgi:hypothetical protein